MDWNFSFGWMFLGLLITVAGTLVVLFHRQIADNMAGGVSSYDKVKIFGIVAIGVGFLVMSNLHTLLLSAFVQLVFKRNG